MEIAKVASFGTRRLMARLNRGIIEIRWCPFFKLGNAVFLARARLE
jgi:hypothetical protein